MTKLQSSLIVDYGCSAVVSVNSDSENSMMCFLK